MPALVATRFEPHIKGYYSHMINNNGLKKMQALCAVMRKLLHAIHGMLKANKSFEGERFYKFPVEVVQSMPIRMLHTSKLLGNMEHTKNIERGYAQHG